jgi:hypothetical protein
MDSRNKVRYRISKPAPDAIVLRGRGYRLNRSRHLDGKPGKYNGKPIVHAVRFCPPLVLRRAA